MNREKPRLCFLPLEEVAEEPFGHMVAEYLRRKPVGPSPVILGPEDVRFRVREEEFGITH